MAATEMVDIRIDKRVKAQAAKALSAMGLSVSDAVGVLLTRVAAEKALPFELIVPNAATAAAMKEVRARGVGIVQQCLRLDGRPECGGLSSPMLFDVTSNARKRAAPQRSGFPRL
jgi:DNA-damage-inducible protein J